MTAMKAALLLVTLIQAHMAQLVNKRTLSSGGSFVLPCDSRMRYCDPGLRQVTVPRVLISRTGRLQMIPFSHMGFFQVIYPGVSDHMFDLLVLQDCFQRIDNANVGQEFVARITNAIVDIFLGQ